jgi:hypothetical protein
VSDTKAKKAETPLPRVARPVEMATVRKAEKGDAAALADVREMLKGAGIPEALCGNVAREALRALVASYAGENPVIREAVLCKLAEMRAELSGPSPTGLEKLLVERILATWLHLHHLESVYARKDSLTLSVGTYYQKSISAAQKRYLAAVKGLGEVRKMALPALQVNIARKQVNVLTAPVAPPAPTD